MHIRNNPQFNGSLLSNPSWNHVTYMLPAFSIQNYSKWFQGAEINDEDIILITVGSTSIDFPENTWPQKN